jgi:hypothetical protein
MTEPLVLDDSALTQLLGPIVKTPYEEGIRRCFEAARSAASARGATGRSAAKTA